MGLWYNKRKRMMSAKMKYIERNTENEYQGNDYLGL